MSLPEIVFDRPSDMTEREAQMLRLTLRLFVGQIASTFISVAALTNRPATPDAVAEHVTEAAERVLGIVTSCVPGTNPRVK